MPKTCVQTVEVFPSDPWNTDGVPEEKLIKVRGLWLVGPDYVLEQCPVRPAGTEKRLTILQTKDALIVWFPEGQCEVHMPNGTRKVFWPKPTVADAIVNPPLGECFRFHADGAVEQTYKAGNPYSASRNFYWSADVEAEPVQGEILMPPAYWCQGPRDYLVQGAHNQWLPTPHATIEAFPGVRVELNIVGDWNLMMRTCACEAGARCPARLNFLYAMYDRDIPPATCGDCGDCRECLGDYDTDCESDDTFRPGWQRPHCHCDADD
jgi:hypothetical protein